MARGSGKEPPKQAQLSPDQMRAAIVLIDRRLAELEAFDPTTVRDREDPRIGSLKRKLDDYLLTVFGHGTVEYEKYHWELTELDRAGFNVYGTPLSEVIDGLKEGKAAAVQTLTDIKDIFTERLEATPVSADQRAIAGYRGLDLHPEIERASAKLFTDGHYANAIEDAVKALNALVRMRSGKELDGDSLMTTVFSPNNPILKFNPLADESDKNEQKGFMMLFQGAVAGLRNPRAHKIIKDDPESALEFIAFISLLAKLVDRAKK